METALLIITGTLTTLLAGVFFGYAVSVNPGLHRLKDSEYVRAMQSINIVIQNPLFFLSFMGPLILLPWVTFLAHGEATFGWLLAATITYVVGSFGVTVAGNVPLNEKLARADVSQATAARAAFEKPWNALHAIRTLASIAATVLFFAALTV